jgi:hypothetical protein
MLIEAKTVGDIGLGKYEEKSSQIINNDIVITILLLKFTYV